MAITGAGGFLGQLARAECEDLFGTDLWASVENSGMCFFSFGHLAGFLQSSHTVDGRDPAPVDR